MSKASKKITTIILALAVAFAFIPPAIGTADAAAKTPSKVSGIKCKTAKTSLILTWSKTKNAKKYEVYQLKSKKYKKVKTTSSRKAVIKNLWPGTKYKFKIRAINGKKKGKYSTIKTFKTKASTLHKTPITKPDKSKYKVGDTYILKNNDGVTTKFTVKTVYDDYINGKTSNGGIVEIDLNDFYAIDNDVNEKLIETNLGFNNNVVSDTYIIKLKDANLKAYWAIDGTEPKIGQADKFGKSPYVHFNDEDFETQLRGTFSKKGTHSFLIGDRLLGGKRCVWVKIYKNKTLILEEKLTFKQ